MMLKKCFVSKWARKFNWGKGGRVRVVENGG